MTTMTLTARSVETRLRPLYATGLILAALLSACVAHDGSLRLAYFLTIPFTRCAFFTLRRFREPTLASVFVVGALIVMCATLSMIVMKRQ
jgi:hypothetical protein